MNSPHNGVVSMRLADQSPNLPPEFVAGSSACLPDGCNLSLCLRVDLNHIVAGLPQFFCDRSDSFLERWY